MMHPLVQDLTQLKDEDSALHRYTGLIGLTVSGAFLMLIAILNLIVMVSIIKVFLLHHISKTNTKTKGPG